VLLAVGIPVIPTYLLMLPSVMPMNWQPWRVKILVMERLLKIDVYINLETEPARLRAGRFCFWISGYQVFEPLFSL
jgi:hypothetical protein